MIKIGMADGQTLVKLSAQEFTGIAGKATSNYADGETISLIDLRKKLSLVDNNKAELTAIKELCQSAYGAINDIGL